MAAVTVPNPLVDAVTAWEEALRGDLVERDEEIHLFALALAAREHLFFIGKPGLAKTLTIERGVAYIDGVSFFIVQLGQLSTRDETEGPVSLKGLENDEYRRMGRGYSTDASIVVWDEGMKGSKSLLNSGLRLMEEREYNDNGVSRHAPLSTFVVTANEERQSDEQEAFDDRLLLRKIVDRVRDRDNIIRLLKLRPVEKPQPVITWGQWEQVQKEVEAMPVADAVYEMIVDIEHELLAAGIEITPRRLRKCIPIVQAEAFLEGAAQAETEHVASLENCSWLKVADQPAAQQIVLAKAAPLQQKGLALLHDIEKIGIEVDALLASAVAANEPADTNAAALLQKDLTQANTKLKKIAKDVGSSRRQRDLVERCQSRRAAIASRLLTEAFDISPEVVAGMVNKDD